MCHFEHSEKSIHIQVSDFAMYRSLPLVEMTNGEKGGDTAIYVI